MCSFTKKYPHYVRNLKLEGQRTLAKKRLERHVYPANMAGCINDRALLSGFKLQRQDNPKIILLSRNNISRRFSIEVNVILRGEPRH